MIDVAAEPYFWIEQWQKGSSISSLGLAEIVRQNMFAQKLDSLRGTW
jgi:hypothetical protein